jgi:hypothetical protein
MSTITAHADHATLINVFTVQPERARELAEAMQAMRQDPTARQHMAQCAELADGFEPHLYTVESVHSAP